MCRILFIGAVVAALTAGVGIASDQQPVGATFVAQSVPPDQGPEALDSKSDNERLRRADVTASLRENRKIVSEHGIEVSTLVEIG